MWRRAGERRKDKTGIHMTRLLTAALLLAAATPAFAQDAPDRAAIADRYFAAYESMDLETVGALLAEDAVFIDITSLEHAQYAPGWNWTGREAILDGVRGFGAEEIAYTAEQRFYGSGVLVVSGQADVRYPNGQVWRFPIVTTVTVDADGRVSEHRDYTDYDGMTRLDTPSED